MTASWLIPIVASLLSAGVAGAVGMFGLGGRSAFRRRGIKQELDMLAAMKPPESFPARQQLIAHINARTVEYVRKKDEGKARAEPSVHRT